MSQPLTPFTRPTGGPQRISARTQLADWLLLLQVQPEPARLAEVEVFLSSLQDAQVEQLLGLLQGG